MRAMHVRSSLLRRDRGSVVPLVALCMVALVTVLAIVVDLGQERAMRRDAQAVADLAALAGAQAMTVPDGTDPVAGCNEAVSYLKINIDLPDDVAVDCSAFADVACSASTEAITATDGGSAGRYHIEITWPVPDSEILDPNVDGGLREFDGFHANDLCDRLRVRVGSDHAGFFSGVVGRDELSTQASAVARRLPYTDTRAPNLWLLEPFGCDLLTVPGSANIVVGTIESGVVTASGLITADSSGDPEACGSAQNRVIQLGGNGKVYAVPNDDPTYPNTLELDPPGEISLYAYTAPQVECVNDSALGNVYACDPADAASLLPVPTRRPVRATRAPVDWVYNCKDEYPEYESVDLDASIDLTPCPDADGSVSFIDELYKAADTYDFVSGSAPAGWQRLKADLGYGSGANCSFGNGDSVVLPPGNYVVDCNLSLNGNAKLAFSGGNVAIAGSVSVSGSATLVFNGDVTLDGSGNVTSIIESATARTGMPGDGDCVKGNGSFHPICWSKPSKTAAIVYQLKGGLTMNGGNLVANHAAWIQDDRNNTSSSTNDFKVTGGVIRWTPPTDGPFKSLALWSESVSTKYAMAGQAKYDLEGVFFTPEADAFEIAGGGGLVPQTAQFISRKLKVTGSGTLELSPAGLELIDIPPPAAVLIR